MIAFLPQSLSLQISSLVGLPKKESAFVGVEHGQVPPLHQQNE